MCKASEKQGVLSGLIPCLIPCVTVEQVAPSTSGRSSIPPRMLVLLGMNISCTVSSGTPGKVHKCTALHSHLAAASFVKEFIRDSSRRTMFPFQECISQLCALTRKLEMLRFNSRGRDLPFSSKHSLLR